MKKLLGLFAAFGMSATIVPTVISCEVESKEFIQLEKLNKEVNDLVYENALLQFEVFDTPEWKKFLQWRKTEPNITEEKIKEYQSTLSIWPKIERGISLSAKISELEDLIRSKEHFKDNSLDELRLMKAWFEDEQFNLVPQMVKTSEWENFVKWQLDHKSDISEEEMFEYISKLSIFPDYSVVTRMEEKIKSLNEFITLKQNYEDWSKEELIKEKEKLQNSVVSIFESIKKNNSEEFEQYTKWSKEHPKPNEKEETEFLFTLSIGAKILRANEYEDEANKIITYINKDI